MGQTGMRITLHCCDRRKCFFPGRSRSPNLKQCFVSGHSSVCAHLGSTYSSSHCLSTRGERGWIPVQFLISFIHSFHVRAHDSHDKAALCTDQLDSASPDCPSGDIFLTVCIPHSAGLLAHLEQCLDANGQHLTEFNPISFSVYLHTNPRLLPPISSH